MTAVRRLQDAQGATVDVRRGEESVGHGLLLELDRAYVLTCHHVVTGIEPAALRVVARQPGGGSKSSPASVVPELSRPERDAVVLRVHEDLGSRNQPWLHAPGPSYRGGLQATVSLSPREGRLDTFPATLGAASENFVVPGTGDVGRYVLPRVHPLHKPGEADHGTSGGVVVVEDAVVGLVHFARPESSALARGGVANPLSAWADGWDELERRIQPLADAQFWERAWLLRADAVEELAKILRIEALQEEIYVPRDVETSADTVWKECRSLLLLGRRKSGKSRIVKQLLRAHPEAVVVVPTYREPPASLDSLSSLVGREVILLVENLGTDTVLDPTDWWDRIRAIDDEHTVFVATCRAGEDWDFVLEAQASLARRLERSMVYTSNPPEGFDFTREEGWELAEKLGLTEAEFNERFDGTPGSLFEDGPGGDGPQLPSGQGTGIALRPLGLEAAPSNVPAFTSDFVGREDEVEALKGRIGKERLVTLTGPSGAGKTRLAFHVASKLLDHFPDGVWVAELSPYRSPRLVPTVVAKAIGLGDAPPPPPPADRIVAFLRDKRVLLVLNGCDHVCGAAAGLAEHILDGCPEVACLATSRDPLGARGEAVHSIRPLDAEPADSGEAGVALSEAAQLFVKRAEENGSPISGQDLAAVAEIVRLVAGNPLAIELMAGQLGRAFGGAAAKLVERLRAETDENREAADPPLAVAADVVSEGFDETERLLFRTVCVFVGGFTIDAAQALGAQVGLEPAGIPERLRGLIDRQLILIDKRGDGADRYRILETVRQEGRRRLEAAGRLEEVERIHADYFLLLAEKADAAMGGPGEAAWLDRLDRELENVRAALLWARHTDHDVALRLGASLVWFWYQRGHIAEGRRWVRELLPQLNRNALANAEDEQTRRRYADLLNGAGRFAYIRGELDEAEAYHREALALREGLSTDRWVASSRNNLGLVARRRGNRRRAERNFRKAIEINRAHGNAFWEAAHLNNLGQLERDWGDPESARRHQEQSLTIAARLGASWGIARALVALGVLDADANRLESAREFLERARAHHEEMGNPQGISEALAGLARVARLADDRPASVEYYREALERVERLGDLAARAELLEGLGLTLLEDDPAAAARALGAAKRIRVKIGYARVPKAAEELDPGMGHGRELLGAEAFEREYRTGLQARTPPVVAELGLDRGSNGGRSARSVRAEALPAGSPR
jgi:predicted ATPase